MDWTQIILSLLALLSAVVSGFLIPYLNKKFCNEKKIELNTMLRILMSAAETYFGSDCGKRKKEWVLGELERLGIKFDQETVQDALEAMYRELVVEGVIQWESDNYLTDEELEELGEE